MRDRIIQTALFTCIIVALLSINSCAEKTGKPVNKVPKKITETYRDTLDKKMDSLDIESKYDLETVDRNHQVEFVENLANIEDEYGEQWDFCTCVIKNDSLNKAVTGNLTDEGYNRIEKRMDYINDKCQAFLVQSPNQTPEERQKHNRKVRDCLKEAGIE